ncbi:MAG: KAP family NTPase, partial [Thaumarchaeota archaeon]|nr:KAP family NTPase [Nitrososphaerota archaeon]
MWPDNETSEDLLGFKVHADLLVSVVKDDGILPATIGVFGDWGSGKSSLLKMVQEELGKDDESLVLYFNGWVFEGYDDAKAALLESIVQGFKDNKKFAAKAKDQISQLLESINWMRMM